MTMPNKPEPPMNSKLEKLIVDETVKAVLKDIREHISLASMDYKITRRSIEQILNLVESEYLDE